MSLSRMKLRQSRGDVFRQSCTSGPFSAKFLTRCSYSALRLQGRTRDLDKVAVKTAKDVKLAWENGRLAKNPSRLSESDRPAISL